MSPRCLNALALVALAVVATPRAAIAESLVDHIPRYCQVRATDHRINVAVEEGLRASPTFRDLVARINTSDVVVYVKADTGNLPPGVDGRLTFLSAIGGFRYVLVRVNSAMSIPRLVSLIAHELQHAREIAETTSIVDGASMAREYAAGLGYHNGFLAQGGRAFDSHAAIRAGEHVLRELRMGE